MTPAVTALLARLAKLAVKKACDEDAVDKGEWRGSYKLEAFGEENGVKLWRFTNNAIDPMRLHLYRSGLEYMPSREEFITDLGTIPRIAAKIPKLHLTKDIAPRAFILHDDCCETAKVRVRDPARSHQWLTVPAKRVDGDLLLLLGLTCDSRPSDGQKPSWADCQAIYRAVRAYANLKRIK